MSLMAAEIFFDFACSLSSADVFFVGSLTGRFYSLSRATAYFWVFLVCFLGTAPKIVSSSSLKVSSYVSTY